MTKTLTELRSILFGTPHSELLEVNDSEFWWCQLFHLLLIDAGEKAGIAGTERKDETRTTMTQSRRETERKGDLYVRKYGNTTVDLGAGESGQYWEGGKKSAERGGITASQSPALGGSITALDKIVVPGLAVYGPKIMRLDLDWIGGRVTRVTSTDWFTLELSGAPDDNLEMFVEVFMFRLLILELEKLEGDKKLEQEDGASLGKLKALKAKIMDKKGLMDTARRLDGSHPTPRK
ncbi:hypothetical protein HK100_003252 [Physocladia obscura]|uniref:Uncharacterized protein n=1 Tax=Physocladia obscura TaxID=109957 RepID=A0AAD5TAI0_9FUNG|nr:hypothetical protein HK100_003252 [Physocladia obscura]